MTIKITKWGTNGSMDQLDRWMDGWIDWSMYWSMDGLIIIKVLKKNCKEIEAMVYKTDSKLLNG